MTYFNLVYIRLFKSFILGFLLIAPTKKIMVPAFSLLFQIMLKNGSKILLDYFVVSVELFKYRYIEKH